MTSRIQPQENLPAQEDNVNYYLDDIIEKLEKLFPDRLPTFGQHYDPQITLIQMGHQEVIRYLKRLHKENA